MHSPSLSFTGKNWHIQCLDPSVVHELSKSLAIEPLLSGLLYLRNIRNQKEGETFLESPLKDLRNPLEIPGILLAADRIIEAIQKNEKITIYGDYDVDGVTATSLMFLVLKRFGGDVFTFLPNRMEHGYGLNAQAVEHIHEVNTDLLITVDNGITANEEVALARSLGMDVIITDHHEPPPVLPDTEFIINPKINQVSSPDDTAEGMEHYSMLSGVGLAFFLLVAVRARFRETSLLKDRDLPNLREYLDLVALGTIADVVPITGSNRILVRHGLEEIGRSRNPGVRALMRVSGINGGPVTPGQVGFTLAPRINAAGRLGDAEQGFRLLISSNKEEVEEIAQSLNQENLKRQAIEKQILEQALEQIEKEGRDKRVLVLYSETWHPGVIGIVASRIVEQFYRPAILIAEKNGQGTGSGRSIPGFSLVDALQDCREELLNFGGHKMAAGLTLSLGQIQSFRDKINRYAERVLKEEDLIPSIKVDGVIKTEEVTDKLLKGLEKLKPFGMGNPEPKFLARDVEVRNLRVVGKNHLRFTIPYAEGAMAVIGFKMKALLTHLEEGKRMDLVFHLRFNDYNGARSIQAVLVDMKPAG